MTVAVLDADSSLTIPTLLVRLTLQGLNDPKIYIGISVYSMYVVHIYLGIIWPMLDEKLFMPSPCV